MSDIRLLVVEDHPLFCDGLTAMVRAHRPQWSLVVADGVAATLTLMAQARFDLVIVDYGLPDGDGLSLAMAITAQRSAPPVMLISGRSDAMLAMRAAHVGLAGFIGKSEPAQAIAGAIDLVLAGGRRFPGTADGAMPAELSPRQTEVLALLAEGLGNKEIRHRLGIAERTVRAHLTELFAALGAHSRTHALIRARALGLIA